MITYIKILVSLTTYMFQCYVTSVWSKYNPDGFCVTAQAACATRSQHKAALQDNKQAFMLLASKLKLSYGISMHTGIT